jgi:arylsulfatase A-like enzyme
MASQESGVTPTVVCAAKAGALVWLLCGAAEAVAVEAASVIATNGHGIGLTWLGYDRPLSGLALAAVGLAIYPLMGALAGAVAALCAMATAPTRRLVLTADARLLWRSVAIIEVAFAFAIHAFHVRGPGVAPAVAITLALAVSGLWIAWRPRATVGVFAFGHWYAAPVALVFGSFAACRWPAHEPLVRSAAGMAVAAACIAVPAVIRGAALSARAIARPARRPRRADLRVASVALLLVVFVLGAVGASPSRGPRAAASEVAGRTRPNVLLITLDTVRADHLSVYGYGRRTTPNLEALAATVYQRAIASSNWTLPSHASIMTGQSPRRHGAHLSSGTAAGGLRISESSTTLAEALVREGYDTRAVVANTAVLLPSLGFGRGFDDYERPVAEGPVAPIPDRYLMQSPLRRLIARASGNAREYTSADEISRLAGDALDVGRRTGKPFFLWLNYMDAHSPYAPPAPFDVRYPGKDASFRWDAFPEMFREVTVRRTRVLTEREIGHLTSQYDGSIAYLDEQLGCLFERMRATGAYDNTLIIITADHGESLGDAGLLAHSYSLNQSQVWVPLLIKYPGQTRRETVDVLASSTDILPTVLDVAGYSPLEGAEGHSLRDADALRTRRVTAESYTSRGPGFSSQDGRPDEMALYGDRLKLVVGAGGGVELYDLGADPAERRNLAGRQPISREWLNAIDQGMEEARRAAVRASPVDADTIGRLRALGYIR